jgi:hypothetical protein
MMATAMKAGQVLVLDRAMAAAQAQEAEAVGAVGQTSVVLHLAVSLLQIRCTCG